VGNSAKRAIEGSRLFVTGVTGFLGKVWLAMVLERLPEVGRVTVLIRGRKGESAEHRFVQIARRSPAFRSLRKKLGSELETFIESKVEVLEGDVSRPFCGLDESVLANLTQRLDAVVHFAGLTDFEPDPKLALETNVLGPMNVANIAARASAKLLHVSTAFVAGNRSGRVEERLEVGISPLGNPFDPDAELAALTELCTTIGDRPKRIDAANVRARALGWPNIYTYSKGLSEHLIARRTDVHTVFARPSITECALNYPFEGWNEGINTSGPLVWLLSSWFRRLPARPDVHFDVVPVDTVARGITVILGAMLRGDANDIYHLASSHLNPVQFERAIELTALGVRKAHARPEATRLERVILRYLDAKPRANPTHDPFPSLPTVRRTARGLRDLLKRVDVGEYLPPKTYEKYGNKIERRIKSFSQSCRNVDRTVGRIEEMLRVYKPFIHDNDYIFLSDNAKAATAELDDQERRELGFDIEELDWRHYWVDVEVPGLVKWSIPILKGERVPEDPAPPRRAASSKNRAARNRSPKRKQDVSVPQPTARP
jgi:long-chain acyl-CoA synthetase